MARTNKKGGNSAKLKYSSPNKFLKNMASKVMKGAGKLLGGGGSSSSTPEEQRAIVDKMVADRNRSIRSGGSMSMMPGMGGQSDFQRARSFRGIAEAMRTGGRDAMKEEMRSQWGGIKGEGPNLPEGAPGLTPAPLAKRAGFKKYKSVMCPSPMKRFYGQLVTGAGEAVSGKGAVKYGIIAKSKALSDISKTFGKTIASLPSVQAWKKKRSLKKNWKADAKHKKFVQRKSKGWMDKKRYA